MTQKPRGREPGAFGSYRKAGQKAVPDNRFYPMRGLKEARLEAGLTQKGLAAKAGVTNVTIVHAERMESESQAKTVALLARALGVHPVRLITGRDWKNPLEETEEKEEDAI